MALIKCPNCGKKISDKAKICPECNKEIKRNYKKSNVAKTGSILSIIGASLLIVAIIFLCFEFENSLGPNWKVEPNKITIIITLSIIIIVLGCLYLKNNNKNTLVYGIEVLILSILSFISLFLSFRNCCAISLMFIPTLSFIGSILIMIGSIKNI